jgi:hypothetical protein
MKLQKVFSVPLMIVGLGAASLLSSPVRAQSETQPDIFDINPGTPAIAEVPAASVATNVVAATVVTQAASAPVPVTEEDVQPAGFTVEVVLLMLILAGGMGSIYVYVRVATRRERQPNLALQSRVYHSISDVKTSSISGATTH